MPTNPSEAKDSPPQIPMIYNGREYLGDLVSYLVNSANSNNSGTTKPIGHSAVTPENVTAPSPSKLATVQKYSVINFVVKGNSSNNTLNTIPSKKIKKLKKRSILIL